MREYFKETKYIETYFRLVNRAEGRKRLRKDNAKYIYYEGHHILPKSLFPEYSNFSENKWNRVLLTGREHFICHILLMKHYKSLDDNEGYHKMSLAIRRMQTSSSNNSKIYSLLRLNLTAWNKGKKGVSSETSLKMSEAKKDYEPWNKGIKIGQKVWNKNLKIGPMSKSVKEKISDTLKEKYKTEEHHSKGKIPWNKGIKGQKAWNKGKKMELIKCPYCDKEGAKGNMKRWHFDNCKQK